MTNKPLEMAVKRYLDTGCSIRDAAKYAQISLNTVAAALHKRGLVRPTGIDPVKLAQAVSLYLAGETIQQASKTAGVSNNTLSSAIKKRGLKRKRPTDNKKPKAIIDPAEYNECLGYRKALAIMHQHARLARENR